VNGRPLLLVNGIVHTMEPGQPRAAAIAVRDGRILFVGDEGEAAAALGAGSARGARRGAEVVDLAGRCVLPGLTDAHLHFRWFAESLSAVDVETATFDEAVTRVRARAEGSESGAWIRGSGWNHNVWGAGALPDRQPLDRAAPRNPVALKAKSGHALWVNSLALAQAGIGSQTPDPAGGRSCRGSDGLPSGILLENAMDLVFSTIPAPGAEESAAMMREAQEALHRVGLTGVHDFDGAPAFKALMELESRGELSLRVVKGIPHEQLTETIAIGLRTGFGGEWITFGQVKMFADGALGPRTAWMLAPYEGTSDTGIPTLSEEQLCRDIARANGAGLGCAVHAIGDAACRAVLDGYAASTTSAAAAPASREPRNRIEHAQLLDPEDLPRLAELGVIASMQPIHATSDMLIAERFWGARCAGAYAWRSLLDSGAALAFGSDCPVEIPDPLAGIHAAVTRRRADGSPGPDGWRQEQRLSVLEAVHAYTMGAAYAGCRERELGSIAAGKLADLTVLDRDIFSIDPREIREARPVGAMVSGRFVSWREP
jgi:predicted amidohydrolase YtcJ